ncbi:MAG: HAD family phosphatase [Anaerolineae bacterium]|nr:HAD family phosphatase [Anaerolineae bacterium]MDQ7034282.1 HAD family phosphatase [Anaerolineae bacterium]
MAIEAVIFDMDGVLVDSEGYWGLSRVEFAQDQSKVWTDDFQREAMGRSTVGWAQVMKNRLELDESIDEIIQEIKARVIAHYDQKMPTRAGALEAVQLAAQHYRVGLASGSPTDIIQHVMKSTGLDQIFEVMIFGDSIPNGKPAPDIYHEAMKQLGVEPQVTVGVEDSVNGIRALKAADMFIIAAPSPNYPLPADIRAMAHAHIESLTEFSLDLLNGIV